MDYNSQISPYVTLGTPVPASGNSSGARTSEAGTGVPLVTNTEFSSPCSTLNGLKAPSLAGLSAFSLTSKRYISQSVVKDILSDRSLILENGKNKFYRFLACKQLSAAFRPNSYREGDIDHLKRWGDEISIAKFGYSNQDDGSIRGAFTGMCRCDSPWICPVCQPSISEYRALEIRKALYDHKTAGGSVVFVTATVSHKRSDSLKSTLNAVSKSMGQVKSGKSWKGYRESHGYIGSIRTLEHTFTDRNGHHPHLHELWFFEDEPDLPSLKKWVFDRYSSALSKHGYTCSKSRGIDIKVCLTEKEQVSKLQNLNLNEFGSIANYWTKGLDIDKTFQEFSTSGVWGVAEELTKHHLKKPRSYNDGEQVVSYNAMSFALHYMDLKKQSSVCFDKDKKTSLLRKALRFKRLFIEYALATFGRSQLHWSKGLKDRFSIFDLTDKEVSEELDGLVVELGSLSVDELQKIVKFRLRPAIIGIIENPEFSTDDIKRDKVKEFISSQNSRLMRYG